MYHDDRGEQPSEVDSGWRLVRAVSDVRDVDRPLSDRTPWTRQSSHGEEVHE